LIYKSKCYVGRLMNESYFLWAKLIDRK